MLKRVYIILLVILLNFSSSAATFALQPGSLSNKKSLNLIAAADTGSDDSAWDDEAGSEDDGWAEDENWDDESTWEEEDEEEVPIKPAVTIPAAATPVLAPKATTVITTTPTAAKTEPAVSVSGPGFKASSSPAPHSALIPTDTSTTPSSLVVPITETSPLKTEEVISDLKTAEPALVEEELATSDLVNEKAKHSPAEMKNLFKVYGNMLQGLDPKNPSDLNEIEKLIEIVGIPTPGKPKKEVTLPGPKPGMEPSPLDPLVNFSARNIPIRDAFATLARVSGKSITVSGLISDRDTISVIEVNNQPYTKAFLSLVEASEVDFAVHGDNYTILKRRGGQTNKTTASFGATEVDTTIPIEDRISDLSYDDESLGAVIKDIGEKYGIDVVMTAVPTDKVTMKVRGVSAEEALELAFAGSQFQYTRKDDAFIVYSKANKNFSLGRKNVFFPLKYIASKDIGGLLPTELKANVKVSDNQNAIIVEGTKDELTQIYEFLRTIDKPIPQVELDVKLVEVSKNWGRAHNILQDKLQIGRIGSYKSLAPDITGLANGALQLVGFNTKLGKNDVSVLSNRPTYSEQNNIAQIKVSQRLVATSGKSAKINFDKEVNVVLNSADPTTGTGVGVVQSARIQRITAGNSMDITPTVGAGGMVTVKIEVEVSANGEVDKKTGVPTSTTRRRISSEVQIINHETISIGGIFDDRKSSLSDNQIPVLGKLPIIGNLFSNRSKSKDQTELLVLITPHLRGVDGDRGGEIEYAYLSGN